MTLVRKSVTSTRRHPSSGGKYDEQVAHPDAGYSNARPMQLSLLMHTTGETYLAGLLQRCDCWSRLATVALVDAVVHLGSGSLHGRARAFALRRKTPDSLRGLKFASVRRNVPGNWHYSKTSTSPSVSRKLAGSQDRPSSSGHPDRSPLRAVPSWESDFGSWTSLNSLLHQRRRTVHCGRPPRFRARESLNVHPRRSAMSCGYSSSRMRACHAFRGPRKAGIRCLSIYNSS